MAFPAPWPLAPARVNQQGFLYPGCKVCTALVVEHDWVTMAGIQRVQEVAQELTYLELVNAGCQLPLKQIWSNNCSCSSQLFKVPHCSVMVVILCCQHPQKGPYAARAFSTCLTNGGLLRQIGIPVKDYCWATSKWLLLG